MTADVAVVAVTAVDVTNNFVTGSKASQEAFKTANLLKSLSVNALIAGEHGTGKRELACYILPNAPVFDASEHSELIASLQGYKEIVVLHIENSPNLNSLIETALANGVRIVATCSDSFESNLLEKLFSINLFLPPLCERAEDVELLCHHFVAEAKQLFGANESFVLEQFSPDISMNASSLRKQIFLHYLLSNIEEKELMQITEKFLHDRLGSGNDYRNFLHIYEVPLIRTGLKRFKSQLQVADKLGLNRNTLRKKIAENSEFGLDD